MSTTVLIMDEIKRTYDATMKDYIEFIEKRHKIKYSNTSRKREFSEYRGALMVALRPYFGVVSIGQLFDKNHATVIHATRNHEMCMKFSVKYREMYKIASSIVLANQKVSERIISTDIHKMNLDDAITNIKSLLQELNKINEAYAKANNRETGNDIQECVREGEPSSHISGVCTEQDQGGEEFTTNS